MRVGLCQINPTLGDFRGNRERIVRAINEALAAGCDLAVFPELALMGYIPNDMLERASIVDEQLKEFAQLQKQIPDGIGVFVGLMTKTGLKVGKPYYNSAALLVRGKKPRYFHKQLLPTYDVFDEARHIEKGNLADGFFTFKGQRCLLTICEDIWGWELPGHPTNYLENPLVALKKQTKTKPLDLVINMSASPFTIPKEKNRAHVVGRTAKNFNAPMVYVNMVGGQDEIIFDGGSIVVDKKGEILLKAANYAEDLVVFDTKEKLKVLRAKKREAAECFGPALVLGIRDYVHKTGFKRVHLGLSGGIDSAVVACLAVEALGPENVGVFTLPSEFNEVRSRKLAEEQAKALGVRCTNIPISNAYDTVLKTLKDSTGEFEFGVVNENLQSRLRGVFMMAISNRENSMLLTTGNKSEYATGYATLYGDMCGGLAPIADLVKGEVYALAELYAQKGLIPREVITRPPSAELRPNQKDQDSLPPYDELDSAVREMVEYQKPARTPTQKWVLETLVKTEFKRWQAPPILKISGHAFGRGRRMPIAQKSKV